MASPDTTFRLLVIANETCPCPALLEHLAERAGAHEGHEVRIVAPALNSRLRHYLSDSDDAVEAARERLGVALEALLESGIRADGGVGDADPFAAVSDALHTFDADEVVLSTHPEGQSHWLETGLVERVRDAVDVPVEHIVSAYGAAPA